MSKKQQVKRFSVGYDEYHPELLPEGYEPELDPPEYERYHDTLEAAKAYARQISFRYNPDSPQYSPGEVQEMFYVFDKRSKHDVPVAIFMQGFEFSR